MNIAKNFGFLFYKEYKCNEDNSINYLIQLQNKKFFKIVNRPKKRRDLYGFEYEVSKPIDLYKDIGIFIYDKDFKNLSDAFSYLKTL